MIHLDDIAVAAFALILLAGIKPLVWWIYRKNRMDDVDAEWKGFIENGRRPSKKRSAKERA